jgi:hypothetical protein
MKLIKKFEKFNPDADIESDDYLLDDLEQNRCRKINLYNNLIIYIFDNINDKNIAIKRLKSLGVRFYDNFYNKLQNHSIFFISDELLKYLNDSLSNIKKFTHGQYTVYGQNTKNYLFKCEPISEPPYHNTRINQKSDFIKDLKYIYKIDSGSISRLLYNLRDKFIQ